MKGFRNCIIALLLGAAAPLLIWAGGGAALYQRTRGAKLAKGATVLACSADTDCPPGFVCSSGRCMPEGTQ